MEGQTNVEPRNKNQMDHERKPAENEGKSWQRGQVRNTLHLVSATAQWILLLACLIYLAIGSLQPSTPWHHLHLDKLPWTHIRYTGESIKGVAMNFSAHVGTIQIKNGSIVISCDGLYLVSLKGFIFFADLEKGDLRKLTLQKTGKRTSEPLWEQMVQEKVNAVNLTTVLFLFEKDYITLWSSSSATISNLSFSLVLQSPFNCSHLQS
ncbi:tumor necrosis factor ligand superfamily member 4 [Melopsittacus undulatus]|uniref:tumor necrosis factor ligand superfamily member 4 n=1 Tax=Melopsittacus undulatus TaxID=13146 RepID=UPI000661E7FC|nr:tumor necrosis factor ligand superfamily member 4 [Melopsittacus undulatus]